MNTGQIDVDQDANAEVTGRLGLVIAVYAVDGDEKALQQTLTREGQVVLRGQRMQMRARYLLTKYWRLGTKEQMQKFLSRRSSVLRVAQLRSVGLDKLSDEIIKPSGIPTDQALKWLVGPWFSAFVDTATLCDLHSKALATSLPPGPLYQLQITDNGLAPGTSTSVAKFYLRALLARVVPDFELAFAVYTSFGGTSVDPELLQTLVHCAPLTELDAVACKTKEHVRTLVAVVEDSGHGLTSLRVHMNTVSALGIRQLRALGVKELVVSFSAREEPTEDEISELADLGFDDNDKYVLRFVDTSQFNVGAYSRQNHELLENYFKFVAWPIPMGVQ